MASRTATNVNRELFSVIAGTHEECGVYGSAFIIVSTFFIPLDRIKQLAVHKSNFFHIFVAF